MTIVSNYSSQVGNREMVAVMAISDESATCETSYKSQVKVDWGSNLPDPAPKVGEVWIIEKITSATWMFVSKVTSGKYNAMRYAMRLDARSCIGKERGIVDDVAKAGIDEVYLRVAGDSMVMWDSKVASDYGLLTYGDHIGQLLRRFDSYGISVMLVFDCELWTSDDEVHKRYRQVYLDPSEESPADLGTLMYSRKFSPLAAQDAISALIGEVWGKYGSYARGVCLDGFGMASEYGDFSYANRSRYFEQYGERPGRSMAIADEDSPVSSLTRHMKWVRFIGNTYREFAASVVSSVPGCPVSVIIDDAHMRSDDTSRRLGRAASGIPDDFGTYGWTSVGMSVSASREADTASELRSFEYMVAYAKRMAGGGSPLYELDLTGMKKYDAALEILARYDATTVILGDYADWSMLSDEDVIALSDAMGSYRVAERSELDYIGMLHSSNSHDIAFYSLSSNRRWGQAIERLCSKMLDKLPHRLRIFFDSDMESADNLDGIAAMVVFMASNMSDNAISTVSTLIGEQDRNVVIVGMAGRYVADMMIERDTPPFADVFGVTIDGDREYCVSMSLDCGMLDMADAVYMLEEFSDGYSLVFGGKASSYTQIIDGSSVKYQNEAAPVFTLNRSSMVGIDSLDDSILLDMVGDFALYALGRDA